MNQDILKLRIKQALEEVGFPDTALDQPQIFSQSKFADSMGIEKSRLVEVALKGVPSLF